MTHPQNGINSSTTGQDRQSQKHRPQVSLAQVHLPSVLRPLSSVFCLLRLQIERRDFRRAGQGQVYGGTHILLVNDRRQGNRQHPALLSLGGLKPLAVGKISSVLKLDLNIRARWSGLHHGTGERTTRSIGSVNANHQRQEKEHNQW